MVLQICHDLLLNGQRARQRELWYRLKGRELFSSPRDVAEAVADAASLLAVPRAALGVTCSSKGLVAGALTIHDRGGGPEVDCARAGGGGGHPIPGDTAAIARYDFQTEAAFVLVVEKDTVLARLAQEGLPAAGPCILVTGRGFPDLGTRAFLVALHAACPALPLLGLADWNPSGASILGLYRFGGRGSEEAAACALPTLRWLGARACMLEEAAAGDFQVRLAGEGCIKPSSGTGKGPLRLAYPGVRAAASAHPAAPPQELTPRDQAVLGNLRASLADTAPAWADELGRMGAAGVKAELEAVAEGSGRTLSEVVLAAVEAEDWL